MFQTEEEQAGFRKKYNIDEEKIRASVLTWDILEEIAEDFELKKSEHLDTVKKYADYIRECPSVHSLNYRVKETEHLIEKIIRKNNKYIERGDYISVSNYESKITDLMGIRVLLLFKEDWKAVHNHILKKYDNSLKESFAYIREGDDRSIYEGIIEVREEKPYRSVHYVIVDEYGIGIEIQVRTLYEEAWSEIDHKLRYPYNVSDAILTRYIDIMNRITGVGDEMGSFINQYSNIMQEKALNGVVDDNEVYQFILEKSEEIGDSELRNVIQDKIKQADGYKERIKMSELLDSIFGNL